MRCNKPEGLCKCNTVLGDNIIPPATEAEIPTPLTDEESRKYCHYPLREDIVSAEFARKLEQKNAVATTLIGKLEKFTRHLSGCASFKFKECDCGVANVLTRARAFTGEKK